MQLELQTKIETELKSILQKAIESGEIDTTKLRMVVLSPDSLFEKLSVCICTIWDSYFHTDNTTVIGEIYIPEWMYAADAALEFQRELPDTYIEQAKAYNTKYAVTATALNFDHLEVLEKAYQSYLVCLREELFFQIENAIRTVAASFEKEYFSHVVGFATHKIPYDLYSDTIIQAFAHPKGAGPFYKVRLTLPKSKYSQHYLVFHESGFLLFCPEGTIYNSNEAESKVYNYDFSEISFFHIEKDEIHFRPVDEFQNWKLESKNVRDEWGDKSEEEFLAAFKQQLTKCPEKYFNLKNIPDPVTENGDFINWFNIVLEYNIPVKLASRETIFNYGEEAFRYYIGLLPKTNVQYEAAQIFLATQLFYAERFEESLDLFDSVIKRSDSDEILYLTSLFLLHRKDSYEAYKSIKELEDEQITIELLDTLWQLREPLDDEVLNNIQDKLLPLLPEYKNYPTLRLLSLVLTKLYTELKDSEKALLYLQSVPTHQTFEKVIFKHELKQEAYLMEAYEKQVQRSKERIAFDKHAETYSLNVSEKKKVIREKSTYENCFYVTHKIKVDEFKWAYPLSASTFIAVRKANVYEFILAKITSGNAIEILQIITLPDTCKSQSCTFADGVFYIVDRETGIKTYKVSEHSIEESDIVYRNKKAKAEYENLTVSDGYLYVSNNDHLEIYELNNPEKGTISDSLYINSGYFLFVQNNLLVVGAGAGLLILVDISDKTNPLYLSTILEDCAEGHIAFIGDHMVSRSVYNIQDPSAPQWISFVGDALAPTYYFAPKPEVSIISTGGEFLFTTILVEDQTPAYTNWWESLNADNLIYESAGENVATAYLGDNLVTFSKHEIILWEKGLSPVKQKVDIHAEVEKMVHETFLYLLENHPEFSVGKVILKFESMYKTIEIAFHAASTLAILASTDKVHQQPIVSAYLHCEEFSQEVLKQEYDAQRMQFVYDGESILFKLADESRFKKIAARHVLVSADKKSKYIHFLNKEWKPFRSTTLSFEQTASVEKPEEIASKDEMDLHEILEWLNKKAIDNNLSNSGDPLLTNRFEIDLKELGIKKEISDEEGENNEEKVLPETILYDCYLGEPYFHGPFHSPEIEDDEEVKNYNEEDDYIGEREEYYNLETDDNKVNSSGDSTFDFSYSHATDMRLIAFEKLCALPDRNLVRNIIFNGMKFGHMHFSLKDLPAYYEPDLSLIISFVNNVYGLWDEFGQDPDIRLFLMSNISYFETIELQAKIAYRCGQPSDPFMQDYLRLILENDINYYSYKGLANGINIFEFPAEALKPIEKELLEKLNEFETTTDAYQLIVAEEQEIFIYDMLCKLGHENIPVLLQKKFDKAVKEYEEYGRCDDVFDEYYDESEDETAFIISIYRRQKVKRILQYFAENTGAIWPIEEAPELYDDSWRNTIDKLLEMGEQKFGSDFESQLIARLSATIAGDASFENDRMLAIEIVQFTFYNIQKRPQLASVTEPLILAIFHHREKFSRIPDIATLKDKSKFALLQAAWNDLKEQRLDLAEQKADAILIMDPNMGQVYFLKARLLWLREGIPAYLTQQETFIEKAAHDVTALSRLYNLTGCALDLEKRYEEALPYFKKAALSSPNDFMYVANVAEIYYKLGKSKEAVQYAKSAQVNGSTASILKEIIENKGVLLNT
jgi:hypothetical protein